MKTGFELSGHDVVELNDRLNYGPGYQINSAPSATSSLDLIVSRVWCLSIYLHNKMELNRIYVEISFLYHTSYPLVHTIASKSAETYLP